MCICVCVSGFLKNKALAYTIMKDNNPKIYSGQVGDPEYMMVYFLLKG